MLATNAAVLGAAALVLSLSPAQVPAPGSAGSILALFGGLTVLLLANLLLLRRVLAPLRQLTELMHRVDPLQPGERIPEYGPDAELVELTQAFNDMLARLERERRDATRRAVEAQEGERRRIAQELHDEIGQGLTGALLQLEGATRAAPPSLRERLSEATETVRASLEEARAVASRLRPEALDDLGLESALKTLCHRVSRQGDVAVHIDLDPALPRLAPEDEIVVYRVAQEALTNVLRHSEARRSWVSLVRRGHGVRLEVSDDGVGLNGARPGGGVLGMRERALLIGATLTLGTRTPGAGTQVVLELAREPKE